MKPLISVVIPAYNKADIIVETINSALSQTYPNIEIIFIDDGSTDTTAQIVKSIKDNRLKYYHQPNSGLPAIPRNKGVALAGGEYIAFLDHDDVWLKQKLEKQMIVFEKDPKIALISTNAFFLWEHRKTRQIIINNLKTGYFNDKDFLPEIKVIQSSVLMKKTVFLAMGGFNEASDLKAREDYDLWLRTYPKYRCYYLNECLVYYRKYNSSTSGSELHFVETSLKHYNNYFASYGFSDKINRKKLSSILHHLSYLQFASGDHKYLENSKRAFQINKNISNLFFCLFLLLPRYLTIKLYQLRKQMESRLRRKGKVYF